MTQYLMSVHHTVGEALPEGEEAEAMFAATGRFNDKLRESGAWVFAGGLESFESATTVDGRGDKPLLVDGPFAESKEYLGGFWIIEATDLDVALKLATEGSKACNRRIEVRPFA